MQKTEAGIFSPDHCIFLPVRDVLGHQPLLKALLPFLLLFACSSTFPGKVTRGKPFDSLQFLDCEIQQKHNQNHVGLLRAMAVSGPAYTKKTWAALKWRKIQLAEERFSLPFTSALGKLDEHTRVCLHCQCHPEQPFITMHWAQSGFKMKWNLFWDWTKLFRVKKEPRSFSH